MRIIIDTNVLVSGLPWHGDQDLLVLGSYDGITIMTPAQALQMLEAA